MIYVHGINIGVLRCNWRAKKKNKFHLINQIHSNNQTKAGLPQIAGRDLRILKTLAQGHFGVVTLAEWVDVLWAMVVG